MDYDIAIIGGGINGCGIARDAAGRGLSVYLCEMGDLAGGTSSRSTKLIHGGLRYLEFFDFRLVREALREREVLWRLAPHVVRPLRFVLPYRRGLRPAWLLRTGLFVYDHLGGRRLLPPARTIDLTRDAAGGPLKPGLFSTGFEYSDCRVDDARLVVLNARDAADRGATIRTRHRAVAAIAREAAWEVTVEDVVSGARETIAARTLVNAAGPWVDETLASCLSHVGRERVRLVQGSHIVVPALFDHDRAYLFQNPDGRIVFAIPYQGAHTLIGTTERDFAGDPAQAAATADEIAYLCEAASEYFARKVAPVDVEWSFSGVRPSMTITSATPRRPRAITSSNSMLTTRRCSRSSAVRSRLIGVSPRPRSSASRRTCRRRRAGARDGLRTRRFRAVTFRWTGARGSPARWRPSTLSLPRRMRAGSRRPMARGQGAFSAEPARVPISARISAQR